MKVKKCLIIYHDDLDGECSAAIAGKMLSKYCKIYYVKAQYNEPLDLPSDWKLFQKVVILDFSLSEKLMEEIVYIFGRNTVWIDHHVSKTDMYEKYKNVPGERVDGTAACELTWKYFFDMTKMPMFVKWISDRDLWKFDYGDDTRWFCEYMSYKDTTPESILWTFLFETDNFEYQLNKGKILRQARIYKLRKVIESNAFPSELDGIKCMKINYSDQENISDIAHIMINKYDVDLAWVYFYKHINGQMMEVHSIRSQNDVDSSLIAKSKGGGGHKYAAGWTTMILSNTLI